MNSLGTTDALLFDRFRLDRCGSGLSCLDDEGAYQPVALGSRALDVLSVLVERRGELVSKDEIMRAVWLNVAVEEHNLTVQISALRRILDADRANGSSIQTVSGRGYRFVAPVTREIANGGLPDEMPADGAGAMPEVATTSRESSGRAHRVVGRTIAYVSAAGLVLVVACVSVLGWQYRWFSAGSTAPRLSIVVLPFQNLSDDHSEDYLAEAITDDLTTDLSHMPQTFVIAHASARAVASKDLDVRQIGSGLGVRYVVEGSVRRIGSTMRINAQLVSAETGGHLWAGRFDRDLSGLASGQDDILTRMRGELGLSLVEIEAGRSGRERPANPDAFDLILRARWWSNQLPSRNRMREVQQLYEQALRLEPTSVDAMTGLANVLSEQNMNWAGEWLSADVQQLAAKLVVEALARSPTSEAALVAQVRLLHGQTRFRELLQPSQRLVEFYPNNPEGYHHLARAMQFEGRFADAVALFDKAIRLDPLEPRIFQRYGFMAFSMMMAGRYDDSAAWFARALAANPDAPPPLLARRYRNMSASLALAGRLDEARQAAQEAQRLWPFDTVRSTYPLDRRSPPLVAHEHVFQHGLSLAGVRDHAQEDADFGVPTDSALHTGLAGYTPASVPGASTLQTTQLVPMLEAARKPIVLDPATHFWGRSIPGAVALKDSGLGGALDDQIQTRLREKMRDLASDDLGKAVVAVGWNSESFDGRNLALRLVALGYTNVYWYRGGREAWEVAGLSETQLEVQDW